MYSAAPRFSSSNELCVNLLCVALRGDREVEFAQIGGLELDGKRPSPSLTSQRGGDDLIEVPVERFRQSGHTELTQVALQQKLLASVHRLVFRIPPLGHAVVERKEESVVERHPSESGSS
nr:hypothetical protein [Fimbriimonas ginsengisoli]